MRLPILNRHSRDEMSAYLDGEFIPLGIEAMQAHLASCESCRTELAALHRLNVDLGALLEVPTPRPAALMPLMAVGPLRERLPATVPARIAALANGMRLAGTAMTLALAGVLVLDLTGSGTTSNSEAPCRQAEYRISPRDSTRTSRPIRTPRRRTCPRRIPET